MHTIIKNLRKINLPYSYTVSLFFLLLLSRRWSQLLNPQVWDEDGTPTPSWASSAIFLGGSNLSDYINQGWHSFFSPVNGYLIMIPKIISGVSLLTGLINYPHVSTCLAWLFIVLVCISVNKSPTYLRGKFLCSIAILIVPSNPEVFGIPLYTFWWAAILLFLLVLWDEKEESKFLRIIFLLAGGLSSPLILLILPALYWRAFFFKNFKFEILIALIATFIAATQLFFLLSSGSGEAPILSGLALIPAVFFGNFFIGNFDSLHAYRSTTGILYIILSVLIAYLSYKKMTIFLLFYLLAGVIILQIGRVNISDLNPMTAGPRYFFYPYLLMYWIVIQGLFLRQSKIYKVIMIVILSLPIINASQCWSRTHDDLNWKAHVLTCSLLNKDTIYKIPVQWDGNKATPWFLSIKASSCKKFIGTNVLSTDKEKTFPYMQHEPPPP